jgi:DNA-binding NarL/FixJ family response regulator
LPGDTQRIALVGWPALMAAGLERALDRPGWTVLSGEGAGAAATVTVAAAARGIAISAGGRHRATLSPDATPEQLRAAIAAASVGLFVTDEPPAAPADEVPAHEALTARELEVFELMAKGLSNRDIGRALGISAHTAKFHVGQILLKTGAATRAEAVHTGVRWGLIGA